MMSHRFIEAVEFANELHGNQVRKGTNAPYISHLLIVAGLVLQHGGDEDEAIAALLHDTVEDCGGKPVMEKIRERFGDKIAGLVDGVTETDVRPKPPWKERKNYYIAKIKNANPSVRLISCADKIHNLRSILFDYRTVGEKVWDKFKADKSETLWFYRSLVDAFRESGDSRPVFVEMERILNELETTVSKKEG